MHIINSTVQTNNMNAVIIFTILMLLQGCTYSRSLPIGTNTEIEIRSVSDNELNLSALNDAILSTRVLERVMSNEFIPKSDVHDHIRLVNQLYTIKKKIEDAANDSEDSTYILDLIDISITKSCVLIVDVINEESFTCSAKEMTWLVVKLDVIDSVGTVLQSLEAKKVDLRFPICEWLEANIYCNSQYTKDFINMVVNNTRYSICKKELSCQ